MPTEKFLISELAERAGTTIRTIRYYADEGLLPQPEIQGKYAYYGLNHLNRLELIRRMKAAYLPLREIQQIMLSLTDEEVQERLAEQPPTRPESLPQTTRSQQPSGAGSNALDYIAQLMDEQGRHRPTSRPAPAAPSAKIMQEPAMEFRSMNQKQVQIPLWNTSEDWQRIVLAPGVEVHLRNPVDAEMAQKVQQLFAFANKLFR